MVSKILKGNLLENYNSGYLLYFNSTMPFDVLNPSAFLFCIFRHFCCIFWKSAFHVLEYSLILHRKAEKDRK